MYLFKPLNDTVGQSQDNCLSGSKLSFEDNIRKSYDDSLTVSFEDTVRQSYDDCLAVSFKDYIRKSYDDCLTV